MAHQICIRRAEAGWSVTIDGFFGEIFFLGLTDAEQAARAIAETFNAHGRPTSIESATPERLDAQPRSPPRVRLVSHRERAA